MSVESVNQFFALDILRGQLEDIKEALNTSLLNAILPDDAKKLESAGLHRGKSMQVTCQITIVNVGARGQILKVEELSRLTSIILSLENTINHIRNASELADQSENNHG